MKKHFLILFLIIFSFSNSFGQSKKEQIEELNYRVDSLVRILGLERSSIKQQKASLEQQIVDLNNSITKLKAQALIDKNSLKTKDEAIVKAASEKAQLSAALKEKNDSLNLVLADLEKLKPPVKKKSNPFGSGNEASTTIKFRDPFGSVGSGVKNGVENGPFNGAESLYEEGNIINGDENTSFNGQDSSIISNVSPPHYSISFGKNKKQQIKQLNDRVDSLVRILGSERFIIKQQKASFEQQIVDLNNSITKLKAQALIDKNSLKTKDEAIVKAASEKAQLSTDLKEKNDSLQIVLVKIEKLKPLVKIAPVTLVEENKGPLKTVTIGTQVWMTKNLDVSTFRNGEIIPEAKTSEEWEAAGKNKQPVWCYYDNDPKNGEIYGKLYNCYAVDDSRGLAPAGWHVPTVEEWKVMYDNIGSIKKMQMSPVYGPTKIKYLESGGFIDNVGDWLPCSNCEDWNSEYRNKVACHVCKDKRGRRVNIGKYIPKTRTKYEEKGESLGWNGDNSSGFSALPGGERGGSYANFQYIGKNAEWWSASFWNGTTAFSYYWLLSDEYSESGWLGNKEYGKSVRCVKDNEAGANGSGGKNGAGKGKSGSEDGGLGKGEGEPEKKPIINASFPLYDIDYDCYIHLQLTVNANGEVVAAKSIKSKTTCTDQRIINQVINEVIRQVKYKKENGAGLFYTTYTIKFRAI